MRKLGLFANVRPTFTFLDKSPLKKERIGVQI